MDVREGKALLSEVRVIESLIRRKLLEAEAIRLSLLPRAIRYDTDQVQTSPRDPVIEVFEKLDEINAEVDRLAEEKREAMLRTMRLIDSVDGALEREVLTAFYVREDSARKIAKQLNYSVFSIYKIIDRAIERMEEE